jgi:hypothetical protein
MDDIQKITLALRYFICHWHKPADNTFEANTLAPFGVYYTSEINFIWRLQMETEAPTLLRKELSFQQISLILWSGH